MIRRCIAILVSAAAWSFLPFSAGAKELDESAADQTTIVYLHGRIIEDEGVTPTHPTYGLYDYPAVLAALELRGANVISDVRPSGTSVTEYAREAVLNIETLLEDGVSPDEIVVVGFSKGGVISIFISSQFNQPDIRYVIMAACSDWLDAYPQLQLTGHVLSVYEESDESAVSCRSFAERSDALESFQEIQIETGAQHGAFYLPRSEWVLPVLDWIDGDDD
jgi:hypothetical protein